MRYQCKYYLPQPPHIAIFVREKADGVITTVLKIVKSAAEDRPRVVPGLGAGEAVHEHLLGGVVTRALSAHRAAGTTTGAGGAPERRWRGESSLAIVCKVHFQKADTCKCFSMKFWMD